MYNHRAGQMIRADNKQQDAVYGDNVSHGSRMNTENELNIIYDFFYGDETLQFSFIRIPKPLFKDEFKHISNSAKLLYGLLLDRSSLSMKNHWLDEKGRVYIIYTIEEICEDMNIGRNKAINLLKELETSAGLIERVRRGLGQPSITYVKNFMKTVENTQKFENQTSGSLSNKPQEVSDVNLMKLSDETPGSPETKHPEVTKTNSNNTDYNNIDSIKTEINHNPSIRSSGTVSEMDEIDKYLSVIYENLECGNLTYEDKERQELFDELVNLLCDVVCVKTPYVRINGKDYPYSVVQNIFMKLRREHLEFVMDNMKKNTKKIANIRNYLISSLYNSYFTLAHQVQNDFNSGN